MCIGGWVYIYFDKILWVVRVRINMDVWCVKVFWCGEGLIEIIDMVNK